MFKRNISVAIGDENGGEISRVVTPIKIHFSPNGNVVGARMAEEATGATFDLKIEEIVSITDRSGSERHPPQLLAEFDLPAEEVDTGEPVDRERRRALLRDRGKEIWRTLGRHLGHLPSDAFRIVYSHGLNQRRVKDVRFVAYRAATDSVVVRDITDRRRQQIPVAMLLTVIDPRSGRTLTSEEEVRSFVRRFTPRSLLDMLFRPRRVPEIA